MLLRSPCCERRTAPTCAGMAASSHQKEIGGAKSGGGRVDPVARQPRQRGCVARLAAPNNLKNRRLESAPASRARLRLGNIVIEPPFQLSIQCVAIGQSAGARKPSASTSEGHGRAVAIALLRSLPPSSDVAAAIAAVISSKRNRRRQKRGRPLRSGSSAAAAARVRCAAGGAE